jgi:streptogramin lyase
MMLSCALAFRFASAAEIRTIAGNGKPLRSGDDGSALEAGVGGPFGVVIGPDQCLYICEIVNHCIRRVDERTGIITTVAGSGKRGYSGDGGPALKALCDEPYEVRFDGQGHMYFVEMKNHVVRKVDMQTGLISTVAGTGMAGFAGDGGPATLARLNVPHSIALDSQGHLYIADIGNHRIRRVDAKTGKIQTVGGTGQRAKAVDGAPLAGTPLDGPRALDFDVEGRLWLALREGNAVFRIDLAAGRLAHVAGTGKSGYAGDGANARQALLAGPKGIAVDPQGDVFIADTESHAIRVIRAATGHIETVVGDGREGDGPDGDPKKCRLRRPHGVFVDGAGNLYIGDSDNNRVRKLMAAPR